MRFAFLSLVAACSAVQAPMQPEPAPDHARFASGVALAARPELRAFVVPPTRDRYDAHTLGVVPPPLVLKLTNMATHPVDVSAVRMTFAAHRAGVPFECKEDSYDVRPKTLAPSESATVNGTVDCVLALPGRYNVRVFLGIGGEPPELIDAFPYDVEPTAAGPTPYPLRPGLFVIASGSRATLPLSSESWARGDYHVVIGVINGSAAPVRVGPSRVSFVVYKVGSPLPCAGQAEALEFPDTLAPGAVRTLQTPITCAPSEEGRYDVVARFTLARAESEITAGHIALTVSRNPLLFAPDPLPDFVPPP